MATISKGIKMSIIDQIDSEDEIQIPSKKQVSSEKKMSEEMICEVHSSAHKKQEIRYINLAFIAKNRPEFYRTFLCSVCFSEIKRKSPNDLGKIKSIRRFQRKYIESVFEKYSDDKPFPDTSNLLEKAETQLCGEIDSLNQRFNQYCDSYKKKIKEIFQTLRKPVDTTQVRQFVEGKLNEGMIEEFYKNYQLINKYNVLIGNNNQQALEDAYKGFNASMEKIQKDTEKELNQSLAVFKKFIWTYNEVDPNAEKREKMVPEREEKREVPHLAEGRTNIQKRRSHKIQSSSASSPTAFLNSTTRNNQVNEKQENEVRGKKKIEQSPRSRKMREDSPSSQFSDNASSDDSSHSQGQQNEKKDMVRGSKFEQKQRQEKKQIQKRHMIQKQRKAKPSRNQNVYMIDEEFMKGSRNRQALYIVINAHTSSSASERVHRMDIEEFKRRYPQAFNRYTQHREAGK